MKKIIFLILLLILLAAMSMAAAGPVSKRGIVRPGGADGSMNQAIDLGETS